MQYVSLATPATVFVAALLAHAPLYVFLESRISERTDVTRDRVRYATAHLVRFCMTVLALVPMVWSVFCVVDDGTRSWFAESVVVAMHLAARAAFDFDLHGFHGDVGKRTLLSLLVAGVALKSPVSSVPFTALSLASHLSVLASPHDVAVSMVAVDSSKLDSMLDWTERRMRLAQIEFFLHLCYIAWIVGNGGFDPSVAVTVFLLPLIFDPENSQHEIFTSSAAFGRCEHRLVQDLHAAALKSLSDATIHTSPPTSSESAGLPSSKATQLPPSDSSPPSLEPASPLQSSSPAEKQNSETPR